MRLMIPAAVCTLLSACAPYPAGEYYEGDGPRRPVVQSYRGDDRRYDDRRYDERRSNDRRDDRRDDRARNQDSARRQDQYNSHVRDIQTQHNQRVTALQQQFNQGRLNRSQLDAGYRDAERDMNSRIANEQRALPR